MQVDHPFFPPSSAETQLENGAIENLLDKLNGQLSLKRDQSACLDGPYPAEIMQRLYNNNSDGKNLHSKKWFKMSLLTNGSVG